MTLDQPLVVSEPPRSTSPARRVSIPLPAVAAVLGAIPFAMHAWSALHGYFWQDDFVIAYRAANANPFDPGYLFQAYNGEHIAPGMFLLAWLVTAIAPASYPVAVLPLLIMQSGAVVLFWRLLVRCFGARPAILTPFAVFAWSPLILLPTLWWAYGVQLIPLLLAMIGALHAHVRYLQEGSPRQAGFALIWTVIGMAFYEKAALIPALLLAITLLLAPEGDAIAAVRRHARLFGAYAGLLVLYAIGYLAITSTKVGVGDGEHTGFAELARRLLLDTFLPGLFGGPLGGAGGGVSWNAPAAPVRVLAILVGLGLVIAGLRSSGRRAGLAWVLLAAYIAVDLALLALTRLRVVGTLAGTDPRYIADAVPVAVLVATFAFLSPRARRTPRAVGILAAVLTVAFTINATVSYLRLAPAAQARQARDYVTTATDALARDPAMYLFDGTVPADVVIDWFGPDARPSRVLGLVAEQSRFDRPGETLYVLDDVGRPRRIQGVSPAVAGRPGPVPDCGYAVTYELTPIPLLNSVRGKLIVRLGYYTADGGDGQLLVGTSIIPVRFESGVHALYVPVDASFSTITAKRVTGASAVCVTDVQVGVPVG